MQKHGVILDMSCDKFIFWPGHCQHLEASRKLENRLLAPLVKELAPTLKINGLIRKEQLVNNTPKYIISARKTAPKAASKVASKVLEAQQAKVLKVNLKASSAVLLHAKKPTKPLELAMVSAASFQYLTKQKSVEIFGISMRDLEYQLNKAENPATYSATVVFDCYHNFLDIFLKEASNTVSQHSSTIIKLNY